MHFSKLHSTLNRSWLTPTPTIMLRTKFNTEHINICGSLRLALNYTQLCEEHHATTVLFFSAFPLLTNSELFPLCSIDANSSESVTDSMCFPLDSEVNCGSLSAARSIDILLGCFFFLKYKKFRDSLKIKLLSSIIHVIAEEHVAHTESGKIIGHYIHL